MVTVITPGAGMGSMRSVRVRGVLNRHRRDPWFLDEYSVNPYQGCGFGCIYCYTRGSVYGRRGLAVKVDAPRVLRGELAREARRGRRGFIAIATATEAWAPGLEDVYGVTRGCLEAVLEYMFPVHCLTKSTLILRDIDLLRRIDREAVLPRGLEGLGHGVYVTFSFSTLDEELAGVVEPGAPPPRERLEALGEAVSSGLEAGAAFMPVLPALSDGELEDMARAARDAGARYVFFSPLSPSNRLFAWLVKHRFPDRYERYLSVYGGGVRPSRRYREWFYRRAAYYAGRYGLKVGIV